MKLHKIILGVTTTFTLAASLQAAEYSVRITGSTAFRTQANAAIRASLTNVTSAYVGTSSTGATISSSGASISIFTGSIGSDTFTIYTNFSGSTSGVAQVATQSTTSGWIKRDPTPQEIPYTRTSGAGFALPASPGYTAETATADLSFSDVEKTLTNNPNATLGGGPVGVVPFQFAAQKGADDTKINNITDQIVEVLYSTNQIRLNAFSGISSDDQVFVLASGRDSGSGTRATVLSETKYGNFRTVKQFQVTSTGANSPNDFSEFGSASRGLGYPESGDMRAALQVDAKEGVANGTPAPAFIVGYAGASDLVTIAGYNQATGTYNPGGPVPLKYNGARYSRANVINGTYTLWGYQQLYTRNGISAGQLIFDTQLRANIPNQLTGDSVLSEGELKVTRGGGDGGLVSPK